MFRKLTLFALFLALCVVVLGAYVRIADAGLGCPDWPGCFGQFIPETPAAGQALERPFEAAKAWKEMAHRYLAGGLGICVVGLFIGVWWVRQRRWAAVALSLLLLMMLGVQAALGMWAVKFLVMPVVVLAHLLVGFVTLALLYWLYLTQRPEADTPVGVGSGLRWLARLGLFALLLQIALGAWTSANYAGLACPDFPTCLGSFSPPVDYRTAFSMPNDLSVDYQGGRLSHSARAAIHWSHRVGAVVTFLLLGGLFMCLSYGRGTARLGKAGVLLSFLLLVQISLGIAAVLLRLPLAISVAHSAVAMVLWLNVVHIAYFLRAPRREQGLVAAPQREALPSLPTEIEVVPPPAPVPEGLFERLKSGLGKTRGGLTGFLANLALGKKAIDRELLEDIEAQLLMADIGVTATGEIIRDLTEGLERSQLNDVGALTARLRNHLYDLLEPCSHPLVITSEKRPFVILVVGVNGVGKTTTIGKLAKHLQNQGHSVMLAAGDTFRAAAVEQLQTWGERNNIHVVAQHSCADSASVIYDGVQAAQSRGVDVLIADTAGRLHTKSNLMEELTKIRRIMGKLDPSAPHEVLLVLDAGTGQNAINQARQFHEAVGLTGLVLTKLDGTAKGGVIFALAKQFGIPVRYIGVGEGIDDLQDFDARKFIDALFAQD